VLAADTRGRDPKEPDGSAATLWGKINPKSFGNRVQFSKPGSEGDAKRCVWLCGELAARTCRRSRTAWRHARRACVSRLRAACRARAHAACGSPNPRVCGRAALRDVWAALGAQCAVR
jgi:hypothetical protein